MELKHKQLIELTLTWQDAKGNGRSFDKEKIDRIVGKLGKKNAIVTEIEKKPEEDILSWTL